MVRFNDMGLNSGGVRSVVSLGNEARGLILRVLQGDIAPSYAEWDKNRSLLCELAQLFDNASSVTITVESALTREDEN